MSVKKTTRKHPIKRPRLEAGQIYRIVWLDAFIAPSPWWTEKELVDGVKDENLFGCDTVGFFVRSEGRHLIFAAGIDSSRESTIHFHGFAVPRAWVKQIVPLIDPTKKKTSNKVTGKKSAAK